MISFRQQRQTNDTDPKSKGLILKNEISQISPVKPDFLSLRIVRIYEWHTSILTELPGKGLHILIMSSFPLLDIH